MPCYIFRKNDIEEASKRKEIDENKRIEINFINHFTTPENENVHGNWIFTYHDDNELLRLIDGIEFF